MQVGDRVRLKLEHSDPTLEFLKLGEVYTVTSIRVSKLKGWYMITVEGSRMEFFSWRFELVEEEFY